MKFNLNDFVQLDTKELLAVNGGSSCGGGSTSSTSNATSYSSGGGGSSNSSVTHNSNGTVTYHQTNGQSFTYGISGGSGSSGGGSCNGASDGKTVYSNSYYGGNKGSDSSKTNNPNGQGSSVTSSTSKGGGSCTGISNGDTTTGGGSSETETKQEFPDYLICTNSKDVHCDIIAWNHAVDAGLDPRGKNGTDWDVNNKTVDQIYNEHFVGKDVDFDGKQAGKMGYILYDWEGDGSYDHIEFGSISEDGLSYSYYSNNGFNGTDINSNSQENYYTRTFANDSNAHCDNNGSGIVYFIPLN